MESGNGSVVPGDEATATGAEATPPDSAARRGRGPGVATDMPSRRTSILRAGVIVGVLVVVFGIILPQFVDYGEVNGRPRRADAPPVRR